MPPEPKPRAPEKKSRFQLPEALGPGKDGKPGWRVHPSADGRGSPPPRSPMRRWRLWPILAALLILNYWIASTIPDKPARAHIAYSPPFLREVQRNNARLVTISEQSIEGEFKQAVTFDKKHFTRFETNQPALPTDTTLLGQLKARDVEINAKAPDSGRGVLAQILLGFGPTLLILGIIIFAMRRATSWGRGVRLAGGSARTRA